MSSTVRPRGSLIPGETITPLIPLMLVYPNMCNTLRKHISLVTFLVNTVIERQISEVSDDESKLNFIQFYGPLSDIIDRFLRTT